MKWWNLRLRYITIQKIRVVYRHGYTHDMWVYDLKEEKDGSYSWECFEEDNKIIDLDPQDITSIFVVKKKRVWSTYEKAGTVLNQFKPKPKLTQPKIEKEKFAPYRKYYDKTSVKDAVQIIITQTIKEVKEEPVKKREFYKEQHSDRAKAVESIYITMTTPEQVVKLRQEILQLERRIAKLKGRE